MKKDEVLQLADLTASLARRRVGYDYVSLLVHKSIEFMPDWIDLTEEEAIKILFMDYDCYMEGLDRGGRKTLAILKRHLLMDLAQAEPRYSSSILRFISSRRRFLTELNSVTLKAKIFIKKLRISRNS